MSDAAIAEQTRVTQAEYGRIRDMSRQRVGQLVKDGRIPLDDDGLVLVEQADANLEAMLDRRKANRDRQIALSSRSGDSALPAAVPAARPPAEANAKGTGELPLDDDKPEEEETEASPNNSAANYWFEKARREKIEADRAELAYRKAIGEVVNAQEVARSRQETAQRVASALLQMPSRIAPVIAPQDPQRAERLMNEEINRILNELAGDLDQPAAGGDAERPAPGTL